jgi:hypothetical protein
MILQLGIDMIKKAIRVSALAATLLLSSANAGDLFSVTATMGATTAYKGASTVQDLFDAVGTQATIQTYLPGYNGTQAVDLVANYRGVRINFSYAGASNTLVMSIPDIGVSESFAGTSRENSQDMLGEWMKSNGASAVEKLMKKLAEVSPVDPIAGNPNSLMSQNVATSFNYGFSDVVKNKNYTANSTKGNAVTLSAQYFALKDGDISSKKYALPLSYSVVSDSNPDRKFNILVPIAMTDVEGSKAGELGLGFSANLPMTQNWTLTPAILYGVTGSVDLGSLGQVGTASITSAYKMKAPGGQIGIGNMVAYASTLKLYSGEYAYDPGIRNVVFKNGIIYDIDMDKLATGTSLELFANHTQFTGTKLYTNSYMETGFAYGFVKVKQTYPAGMTLAQQATAKAYESMSQLRLGLSYLTSAHSKGFQVNFGYTF